MIYEELDTFEKLLNVESAAASFFREAGPKRAFFCREKFKKLARHVSQNLDSHGVLVGRSEGRVLGFLYCTAGEPFLGRGTLISSLRGFYLLPEARNSLLAGRVAISLMAGFESWAAARGCGSLWVHVNSGRHFPPRTGSSKGRNLILSGGIL